MGKFVGFIFALAGVIIAWIWMYHGNYTPIDQVAPSIEVARNTSAAVIISTLVIGLVLLFYLFYWMFKKHEKK